MVIRNRKEENWRIKKNNRKILRKILGPKKHGSELTERNNTKPYFCLWCSFLLKTEKRPYAIRDRRVEFYRHLVWMNPERLTKGIFIVSIKSQNANPSVHRSWKNLAEWTSLEKKSWTGMFFRKGLKNKRKRRDYTNKNCLTRKRKKERKSFREVQSWKRKRRMRMSKKYH